MMPLSVIFGDCFRRRRSSPDHLNLGAEVIGVRSMCYLTLTIDHRALDAFQTNAFLSTVATTLEQWPTI